MPDLRCITGGETSGAAKHMKEKASGLDGWLALLPPKAHDRLAQRLMTCFDFCYTRARESETKSAKPVCWLVAIGSQTGYIHVVPYRKQEPVSPNCARVDEFQSSGGVFSNHL